MDVPAPPTGPASAGQTHITVLQPTASVGYEWILAPRLHLAAYAALGAEVNVRTAGQEMGQGAILLGGIQIQLPLMP